MKPDISKNLNFLISGTNLAAAHMAGKFNSTDVGAGTPSSRLRPARGRAGSMHWIWHHSDVALGDAVCLKLFLDLVDDHPAGLIVRKRLRVITVAGMHPNA